MLKLKLQSFGHLMRRTDSLEKTLMRRKTEGRRRRGRQKMRWLDGITDSWTWVWASSGSWWWAGKLVCCSPWGCKKSDATEQLNWIVKTQFPHLQNVSNALLLLDTTKWPTWFQTHSISPSLKLFSLIISNEISTLMIVTSSSFGANTVFDKKLQFLDSNNLDIFSWLTYFFT